MIRNIRHTGIVVEDIEKELWFYHELLGLDIIRIADEEPEFIKSLLDIRDGRLKTIKLGINGTVSLELLKFEAREQEGIQQRSLTGPGYTHWAVTVDDISELYQILVANGISCNSGPLRSRDGKVQVLFCRDPEGNYLELVQES
jgi:catechol 2,3-dioxygenase-like lactoylglutathione lyase family enzyme